MADQSFTSSASDSDTFSHVDVVVCGGGMAGLTAALSAQQRGARVQLIEKASDVGGSALLSGGVLWTFQDYDVLRDAAPHGDAVLQWLVIDGLDAAARWLAQAGVKLSDPQSVFNIGRGWRIDPAASIQALHDAFLAGGGRVVTRCAVETLEFDGNQIAGVDCVREGCRARISASSVILATGGFQGSQDLLTRYVLRDTTRVALRSNPWSTGDGLSAACDAGAALSPGMDKFYGHALCSLPTMPVDPDFRGLSQYYGPYSVALNLDGRRFADESDGSGEELLNFELAQQRQGRGFYVIDGETLDIHPLAGSELLTRTIIERAKSAGADVIRAESIDDLCRQLAVQGLPAARVRTELESFNEAVSADSSPDLSPPRRGNRKPLRSPPFIAVPVQAAITFTMGGLQIDEHCRVIKRAGSSAVGRAVPAERALASLTEQPLDLGNYRETVIPGLYAAGCDVGNISHRAYMGGLACALVTGMTAGRQAAMRSLSSEG